MAPHEHDRGLGYDLGTLFARRRVLGLFAGAGLATLAGCAGETSGTTGSTPSAPGSAGTGGASSTEEIPAETAGPFPGDGSNGPNVLTRSGIVRKNITTSFGTASGKVEGVPLIVELTITENTSGAALPGAAVYLWHCDAQGNYSLYSEGFTEQNWLRGVQAADSSGRVGFTTIFPGAYVGRWPHLHFEVYAGLDEATAAGKISATSQLALPENVCTEVYGTDDYRGSEQNLARTSLADDNVFGDDDGVRQLATVTGDATSGYTARLAVPV